MTSESFRAKLFFATNSSFERKSKRICASVMFPKWVTYHCVASVAAGEKENKYDRKK